MTFSPDGRIACSLQMRRTSMDARGESYVTIKFWEVVTGKLIRELASGGTPVFSPDGKTVATVGGTVIQDFYNRDRQDSKARLWDLTTGRELYQLDTAYPVAFSSEGQVLASAGANGCSMAFVFTVRGTCRKKRRLTTSFLGRDILPISDTTSSWRTTNATTRSQITWRQRSIWLHGQDGTDCIRRNCIPGSRRRRCHAICRHRSRLPGGSISRQKRQTARCG